MHLGRPGHPTRERTGHSPKGWSQVAADHRREPVTWALSGLGSKSRGSWGSAPQTSGLQHPTLTPAQSGGALGQPRARNFSLRHPSGSAQDVGLSTTTQWPPEGLGGTGVQPSTQGSAQPGRLLCTPASSGNPAASASTKGRVLTEQGHGRGQQTHRGCRAGVCGW